MDAGEGWRMLKSGSVGDSQTKMVINPVRLRFRPIAPKPVAGDSGSGGFPFDNKNLLLGKPRSKRKYVRVRKNNGYTRKKRLSSEQETNSDDAQNNNEKIVTLQLLPEKTDHKSNESLISNLERQRSAASVWLNCSKEGGVTKPDLAAAMHSSKRMAPVESWVTLESVTDTCMDAGALGNTDEERVRNLEADTCPGFISDGWNAVYWVNGAYKKMMSAGAEALTAGEITVRLVMKEEPPRFSSSFSCRLRLQYTWQMEKYYSRIVPCDVWRMDSGGFAWRLDVEAALCLGR